jgi:hypothetical protein
VGDNTQRWEPDPAEQYYWPPDVLREYTVPAFIRAYQTCRYELCADGLQERGYEKIVVYADRYGLVKHAARQISDGRWLSKLGDAEDIIHEAPQSLSSPIYGQPVCYLKRPKPPFLAGLAQLEESARRLARSVGAKLPIPRFPIEIIYKFLRKVRCFVACFVSVTGH